MSESTDVIFMHSVDEQHTNSTNSTACWLSMENSPDVLCDIFHIPIADVEVESLPSVWPLISGNVNCVQLECQHRFHASAIAAHFIAQDMRCPVCREGSSSKLFVPCLPAPVLNAFEEYDRQLRERTVPEDLSALQITMHFENLMRDWTILAQVRQIFQTHSHHSYQNVSLLASRIRIMQVSQIEEAVAQFRNFVCLEPKHEARRQEILDQEQFIPVYLQNNFGRHMNILAGKTSNAQMSFLLHHPLLDFQFTTHIAENDFTISKFLDRSETVLLPLQHENMVVGYVSNRCVSVDNQLLCQSEPNNVIMAWMKVELIMQCIVSSVQEQIQAEIPETLLIGFDQMVRTRNRPLDNGMAIDLE